MIKNDADLDNQLNLQVTTFQYYWLKILLYILVSIDFYVLSFRDHCFIIVLFIVYLF